MVVNDHTRSAENVKCVWYLLRLYIYIYIYIYRVYVDSHSLGQLALASKRTASYIKITSQKMERRPRQILERDDLAEDSARLANLETACWGLCPTMWHYGYPVITMMMSWWWWWWWKCMMELQYLAVIHLWNKFVNINWNLRPHEKRVNIQYLVQNNRTLTFHAQTIFFLHYQNSKNQNKTQRQWRRNCNTCTVHVL